MTLAVSEAPFRRGRFADVTPTGVTLSALLALAVAAILYALISTIDGERIGDYGVRILTGFGVTLKLLALSLVIGAVISLPIAAGRLSRHWLPSALAYAYSYFFRGTPLIAQIFLVYYGAGQFVPELKAVGLWWFFRDSFNCAVFSFAINTAAYQAEILSGAIRSVPNGQREAGAALGLHHLAVMRHIVLPQAIITALRPYGNEIVLMTKASSIASIITVLDLMGQTRFIFSKTYDLSYYFWAAAFYLATVEIISRIVNVLERRLTRHFGQRSTAH